MANIGAKKNMIKGFAALFVLSFFVSSSAMFALPIIRNAFAAAPPNIISYQGRILNANGVPDASSSISMEFRLFTAVTGGTCVWSNSSADCDSNTPASTVARSVTLTDGLFSENLGDTSLGSPYAAISDSIFANNTSLYLEVEIAGETLSPRKRIVSSGYALNSQTLDGIDSTGFLAATGDTATGEYDTTGAEFLGASPFVFEGATNDGTNLTTFTVTDPTAPRTITFQDGTGTVAFLSDIGSSLWETGTFGSYEDGAAVIVGADAAFTYADGAAGDLRVTDELEVLTDGYIHNDFVVGASTSATETLTNTNFVMSGDDLFVAGLLGVEGSIYTDAGFVAGAATTYADASISSSTSTFNFLDDATGATTIEIGGVSTDLGNTVSIATEGTTSDFIVIGNTNASTAINIFGGDDWSVNTGVGEFTSLQSAIGAVWSIASDGDGTFLDLIATGRIDAAAHANNQGLNLPTSAGAPAGVTGTVEGDIVWDSTGDSLYVYNGAAFTQIGAGATTTLDDAYNNFGANASIINIDAAEGQTGGLEWSVDGTGDFIVDLQSTGEFDIQSGGSSFFTVSPDQTASFVSSITTDIGFSYFANSLTTGTLAQFNSSGTFSEELVEITGSGISTGQLLEISSLNASSTADLLSLINNGTGSSIIVDPNGSTGATLNDTTGGAVHVGNTGNTNSALTLYSNNGATQSSQLATLFVDNTAFDQEVLYIVNEGNQSGVLIDQLGDASAIFINGNSTITQDVAINSESLTSGTSLSLSSDSVTSGSLLLGSIDNATFTGDMIDLTIVNTGSSGRGVFVDNNGTGSSIFVNADGNTGTTVGTTAGGAVHIDNTDNTNYGFTAYTNHATTVTPLMFAHADNVGFASSLLALRNDSQSTSAIPIYIDHGFTTAFNADTPAIAIDTYSGVGFRITSDGEPTVSDLVVLRGCQDTNPNSDCNYISFLDGDGTSVGAIEGDGAGGITNASSGSDYAELFPGTYSDFNAGDVLALDGHGKIKKAEEAGEIIGAFSIAPNTLGNWVEDWRDTNAFVPVALLGQVPVNVSNEGGQINPGDRLTLSSTPGVLMKQTGSGRVIGMALESPQNGQLNAFVNPHWHEVAAAQNQISGVSNLDGLNLQGTLNMNGNDIISVASISGLNGRWKIEENGDMITKGRIISMIHSYQGEDVETYAVTSRQTTVQLSGTVQLVDGTAHVRFEAIDPQFNDVISTEPNYRVLLTGNGATNALYTLERSNQGFTIQESNGSSNVLVDWMVIADHKDYPSETNVVFEEVVEPVNPEEEVIEEEPISESE